MEKSESITELTKALIQVQKSLTPAIRDKDNPFLKSKYADLAEIWDVCRNLLQENKLAVVQVSGINTGGSYLETILAHESGEWISGKYPLKPVKGDDPQALGSALTYARRYTLAAILGIVTEDDDAEGATSRHTANKPYPEVSPKKRISQEQLNKLDIFQKGGKNIKKVVDAYKWKVAKISDLTFEQAETVIKALSRGGGQEEKGRVMSHSRQRGCPMKAMNPRDNWLGRVLCLTCDVREEEGRFNIGALVPVYERGLGERTCMSLVTSGRIPFQRVYLWRSSPFGLS